MQTKPAGFTDDHWRQRQIPHFSFDFTFQLGRTPGYHGNNTVVVNSSTCRSWLHWDIVFRGITFQNAKFY